MITRRSLFGGRCRCRDCGVMQPGDERVAAGGLLEDGDHQRRQLDAAELHGQRALTVRPPIDHVPETEPEEGGQLAKPQPGRHAVLQGHFDDLVTLR